MEVMRRTTVGIDSSLDLIAKRMRSDSEHLTHEALPARWVDLIHHLNEQEPKVRRRQAETEPRD